MIDVAYHSEHMARVSVLYFASIADRLPASVLAASFYSSVYGRVVHASELQPSYWIDNLVSTVQLPSALGTIYAGEDKPDVLLEIGPHSTLEGPVKKILKTIGPSASKTEYRPSLLRWDSDAGAKLDAAGVLFSKGAVLDRNSVNCPSTNAKLCSLLKD